MTPPAVEIDRSLEAWIEAPLSLSSRYCSAGFRPLVQASQMAFWVECLRLAASSGSAHSVKNLRFLLTPASADAAAPGGGAAAGAVGSAPLHG